MGDFSLTIAIEQPPAVVFAFIAEPTNMTRWYDAVDQVTITAGIPVGLGATFEIIRSLPGDRAINDVEITEYQLNRRITMESRQGPTPFRYTYTLKPIGDGSVLTLDGRISGAGLPGPVAHLGAVATQLFKRGMKRNLDLLKGLVESESSRPSAPDARDQSRERRGADPRAPGGPGDVVRGVDLCAVDRAFGARDRPICASRRAAAARRWV
jgi:uncharacterized protein YndB with AHSA1/START domain